MRDAVVGRQQVQDTVAVKVERSQSPGPPAVALARPALALHLGAMPCLEGRRGSVLFAGHAFKKHARLRRISVDRGEERKQYRQDMLCHRGHPIGRLRRNFFWGVGIHRIMKTGKVFGESLEIVPLFPNVPSYNERTPPFSRQHRRAVRPRASSEMISPPDTPLDSDVLPNPPHARTELPAKTLGSFALNDIYQRDCIEALRSLPDRCADIAIADPPYNASKGNQWKWDSAAGLPGFGGNWSKVNAAWDDMPLVDYLAFTMEWLRELQRVIKPTGSLWIHGTYHNIGIINFALQLLEIEIINEVVWFKRNSFPNLSGRRLTASHETILWAHTGKRREYLFNYEDSKSLPFPEDGLKAHGKQMRTVWDVPNNKERSELTDGKHPTQKPLRLLRRMLALSAKPGQVCLVPFAGSGSECVAASQHGMYFLGFELEREYVHVSKRRLGIAIDESDRPS